MKNKKAYEIALNVKEQLAGIESTEIHTARNNITYYRNNDLELRFYTCNQFDEYTIIDNRSLHAEFKVTCCKNSEGLITDITYSREGIFRKNPKTNRVMKLGDIELYLNETINKIKVIEARIDSEIEFQEMFNSQQEEQEAEIEQPKLPLKEKMKYYQLISNLEDKLFNLYNENSDFFDNNFIISDKEITVTNQNNIFISMNNYNNRYEIALGVAGKYYLELCLTPYNIEITKQYETITADEFIKYFDKIIEILEDYFYSKSEAIYSRLSDIKDMVMNSI